VNLPAPFFDHGEHLAIDLAGARAIFTTRRGGVSSGPFESLNLGRLTDDVPAAVEHNRATLAQSLDVRFAFGRQVHGSRVQRVLTTPPADRPREQAPPADADADGQATTLSGVAPMVLTADCLPIAVAGAGAVAMVHAGWRGLAAGIVGEGVAAVRELAGPTPLSAAIGPGAGPCCYEVSEDVHAAFADRGERVRSGQNLDLKAVAALDLAEAGVELVHDIGLCTICSEPSLFFSHRRDHGVTGRQAGVAWLI
jgi:YfiH family protein